MLRSHRIPSRIAAGIVWNEGHSCFLPYVWTEVWGGNAWYPVDAVTGKMELPPLYVKMSGADLSGSAETARMFAPLMKSMDQLVISVAESDPPQKKSSLIEKLPNFAP
ncbi:MAG: transglutaminase-like domain-containing protein [Planctomycetaceae bacterium]